ncbi:EamA family transporter [Candidatus Liberibacter brunswickensis]|uniref:EamA family transporter n=1 Tax=Candidatus Liberibacter brunswickensis TaxID=1968796 RepID=UPI002FDF4004
MAQETIQKDTSTNCNHKSNIQISMTGTLLVFCSYVIWGLSPLYTQFLEHLAITEVIPHRVIWSLPGAFFAFSYFGGGLPVLRNTFQNKRHITMLLISATLLAAHWGCFVYALLSGQILLTSFSFFVSPVITTLLGVIFLKERLNYLQMIAAALIILSLIIMTYYNGIPFLSLSIAVTWSSYCFARKTIPVNSSQGFFVEMFVLAVPSLSYVLWNISSGEDHFFLQTTSDTLLLIGYGLINSFVFCIFAYGIQRSRITTVGVMEYISPLFVAFISVFVLRQPIDTVRIVVLIIAILAIVIYLTSNVIDEKQKNKIISN